MTRVGEWFRDHITVHRKPAEDDDGVHGELIVSGPSLDAVRNWTEGAYPDAVLVSWNRYGLTGKSVRAMFVPNPDDDLAALAADALAFLSAAATTSAASATIPVIAAAAAEPKPARAARKAAEQEDDASAGTAGATSAGPTSSADSGTGDDAWSADAFALLNSIGIEFGQHVDPLPAGASHFSVALRQTAPTPVLEPVRATRPAVRRERVSASRAPKPLERPAAYGTAERAALLASSGPAARPTDQPTDQPGVTSAAAEPRIADGALDVVEERSLAERLLDDGTPDVVLPEGPRFADLLAGLQNFPEGLLTDATPDSDIVAKPRIPQRRPAGIQA